MTVLEHWQRRLGLRAGEGPLVGWFFLHNFLLGVGTVLVYVAATVLLLEHEPARTLPLAYGVSALALVAAGHLYGRYEHRLALPTLAGRVLLAVVALTGALGALVALGHSLAAAVALMAGYRVIYLLTSLEFWGVAAVVFDVRQSRRLFGVISSGDLPAKALGAVLAVLIHHHTPLLWLLATAFGAFAGAWGALRATGRRHAVQAQSGARPARARPVAPALRRWFGSSRLVLDLCLSLLAVAAVTIGVEYAFFVNVKHKFHDQSVVMQYVGSVLVITYLVALGFKLLLARVALDRVGIRRMLLALPLGGLAGLLGYGVLGLAGASETGLLVYFCGLYLLLEVLRRAVFDPVFLVLFQPLPAAERLQAHTLVKGLYEPLGMALAGGLLFVAAHAAPALGRGATFAWMGLFMAGALWLLRRAYGHYLAELQHALGHRFGGPDATDEASETPADAAATEAHSTERLVRHLQDKALRDRAADALVRRGDAALPALSAVLGSGTDEALLRRAAQVCGRLQSPAGRQVLLALAGQPHRGRRAVALRALRTAAPVAGEAPALQALVPDELHLALALLHGQAAAPGAVLHRALAYELGQVQARIFGVLGLLYPFALVADAQRSVAHAARERRANALELLDNLIPRPWYHGLQTLVVDAPAPEKAHALAALLGAAAAAPAPLLPYLARAGAPLVSDWTLAVALRAWQPAPDELADLVPHLRSPRALVRAGAAEALAWAAQAHPPAHRALLAAFDLTAPLMNHHAAPATIPDLERVDVLRRTALFADTPENVLSAIVPIMKEVTFRDGERIFEKGDLGASLFVVYAGAVGIFNGAQLLATFGPGDFFGELALLDAEPRSAAAVAQGPVVALRLDQDDFYDVMEERGEVLHAVLRVLCQRLRRQNDAAAAPVPAIAP